MKKEVINLEVSEGEVKADSLAGLVPEDSPRYHLFCFKHTHEGDYQEARGEWNWTSVYFTFCGTCIVIALEYIVVGTCLLVGPH